MYRIVRLANYSDVIMSHMDYQ